MPEIQSLAVDRHSAAHGSDARGIEFAAGWDRTASMPASVKAVHVNNLLSLTATSFSNELARGLAALTGIRCGPHVRCSISRTAAD